MEMHGGGAVTLTSEEDMGLRRGPWTVEEDLLLVNYIANHGEGRWNSLARHAGLKRTGKSCRLRWLNYLRPDVRRGNITPEEQLLILELHSRWGNRWSKIAQHLPGRTDNEIKNYWRTRVQKHAKQLQCDVNSKQFKDIMRYLWMPRLLERIRAASGTTPADIYQSSMALSEANELQPPANNAGAEFARLKPSPECSSVAGSSSDSFGTQLSSPPASDCFAGSYAMQVGEEKDSGHGIEGSQFGNTGWPDQSLLSPAAGGYPQQSLWDFDQAFWGSGDLSESIWNVEDSWFSSQQQQS